jgi:transposase
LKVFCGIDWAEGHHDVALVDQAGLLVAKKRIGDDPDGFAVLTALLAAAGDDPADPIPVAIETPRGLFVATLRASGRPVYAINPMAVARYRERHTVSRTKSDHADAMTLANILRTDAHVHRRLAGDSDQVQALAVLARAQQDATWRRTRAVNELRSVLREYYPGFLEAFAGKQATNLAKPEARAVLAIAATPAAGAKLSKARIAAALRKAGRQRGIDAAATKIQTMLREPQLRQLELVEDAFGRQAQALLATLDVECRAVDELGQAVAEAFAQHPDYAIITSFPGLGDTTGARILAELGDDRSRFTDARSVKAYAGSAPITRASGRSISITHRRVKNDRLAAAGWIWAFAAMTHSDHAQAHYQRRRDHGDRHAAALRHLFNA